MITTFIYKINNTNPLTFIMTNILSYIALYSLPHLF
jgi:hypothetical protein